MSAFQADKPCRRRRTYTQGVALGLGLSVLRTEHATMRAGMLFQGTCSAQQIAPRWRIRTRVYPYTFHRPRVGVRGKAPVGPRLGRISNKFQSLLRRLDRLVEKAVEGSVLPFDSMMFS